MKLHDLVREVELLLDLPWYSSSSSITQALAARVGAVVRHSSVADTGFPGQLVVAAEEVERQGREAEFPALLALATLILAEPVLNDFGREAWPGGIERARAAARALRAEML